MNTRTGMLWTALFLLVAASSGFIAPVPADEEVDPRWLDRLDREDRELLQDLVGYAAPEFAPGLTWANGDAKTWSDLRGNVVLLQSWNTRSAAGRRMPLRVERTLKKIDSSLVQVIYLHTPEGAETAQTYLERKPIDAPVVIDSTGEFCDELGVYKRPVNVIVDKHSNVRYVGLNERGLVQAIELLAAEEFSSTQKPNARPEIDPGKAEFPVFTGSVGRANDLRGKEAPRLEIESWITTDPNIKGKVTVLDFWATWCTPCVAMIPHMNEIAAQYPADVQVIGISDESRNDFDDGMEKLEFKGKTSLDKIHYALAIDSKARMKRTFGISAIPHVVVISSDWVVRWQGHPSGLNRTIMDSIVRADKGMTSGGGKSAEKPKRWANERR